MMTKKKNVYFNEFNIMMSNITYLPIVSGLLRAYAETSSEILSHYLFKPFLFHIDTPESIVQQYEEPFLAAFSLSMWNEQLNLVVARAVKERFPACIILFGGCQVPHDPRTYFEKYPFVDMAVRGEGENPFREILRRLALNESLVGVPQLTWRDPETGAIHFNPAEGTFVSDLDVFPSPYLKGIYDELMTTRRDLVFQGIIETNRGCPFLCSYCYWGKGGLSRKYRFHSLERVFAEIQWLGEHGILYIFNADSNFGVHRRDIEIAKYLVETKLRFGFPEKFRSCYGKNTNERIFRIGKLLHQHQLEKGITISFQSMSPTVQENIRRDNIKVDVARDIQKRFNDDGIPVYTELILGLPGESLDSWVDGIHKVLETGLKNQLFVYPCQLFPGTELADPNYRKQFAIDTQRVVLTEIHGKLRRDDWVPEFEHLVVGTKTMSRADWQKMQVFSWVVMTLHSLKFGFFILAYLAGRLGVRYRDILLFIVECDYPPEYGQIFREEIAVFWQKTHNILNGAGRGCVLVEYGELYWDEEEASFLRLSERIDLFFEQFQELIEYFLQERGISYDSEELEEVFRYQRIRIPFLHQPDCLSARFEYNFPEYLDGMMGSEPPSLRKKSQILETSPVDFSGDKKRFAREVLLWGRKSDNLLIKTRWWDAKKG